MTPRLILQGLEHWNNKDYFSAHERWEEYWHTIRKDQDKREEAEYVKGLIRLAVALVHHERGNKEWYNKLLPSAEDLLQREHYPEIRAKELIAHAKSI